jgi:hypothetical protein
MDFPIILAINGGLIPFEATKQLKVENVEEVSIVYTLPILDTLQKIKFFAG